MLREIECLIKGFHPLLDYAYTVRLTLYSRIKKIIMGKNNGKN